MKKVPRVKFQIDERNPMSGVKTMSIVDEPAIESDFVAFNQADTKETKLELVDLGKKDKKYKNILAGLALIPDKNILRFNGDQPYYGYFGKEDVEIIRNKFHKEQMTGRVNVDHNAHAYIDAFMIESFIIDSPERLADVKAKGIEGATMGSWFVAYKIEDQKTFEKALSGELNGFSIEVYLSKVYSDQIEEENNTIKKLESEMNKLKQLVEQFAKSKEVKAEEAPVVEAKKFEKASTEDGVVLEYTEVGQPAFVIEADAQVQAPAKEYKLDNGKTVSVGEDGIVTDVKDSEEAPVEQAVVETPAVVDNSKAELEKALEDIKKLKAELAKEQAEVQKLKKMPLAQPVLKTVPVAVEKKDFSKMTTKEKLFARNGITA